ncbi:unnamed protein product [Cochlearia groenlandica]
MVISNKKIVKSLTLVIILCIVMSTTTSNANKIGNGAMRQDEPKGCPPGSPPSCVMNPVNPYKPGCEASQRCRGG